MKKFVVATAMLMSVPMFFAAGCQPQQPGVRMAGSDWYSGVPAAEHERLFPGGHPQIPGPAGEDCVYHIETETYFCQFVRPE